ncbi:MAG: hypothetical protein ACXAD7_24120, partial [Candidatus Kariarchaeaceae archaeon]
KFYSVIRSFEKGPKVFTRELLKSGSTFFVRGIVTPLASNTVLGVFGGRITGKIVDGLFTASLDSVYLVPEESAAEDLEAELLKQQMERELELAQIKDKYGPNATVTDIINHKNSTNYKIKEFFNKHKAAIFSALVSTAIAGVMMVYALPLLVSYFPFLGSALGLSGQAMQITDIVLNNLVYPYLMPLIANWLKINVIVEYLTNKFISGLDMVVPDVVRRKIKEKFGFDIVRNVVTMTIFSTVFNAIFMTALETGVMSVTTENILNLYSGLTLENFSNLQHNIADTTSKILSGDITLPEGANPMETMRFVLGYTSEAEVSPEVAATDESGSQKPDNFWETVPSEKREEIDNIFKDARQGLDQLRTQIDNQKDILNSYKEKLGKLNELSNNQRLQGFEDQKQQLEQSLDEYQHNIDQFDKNLKGYEDEMGKLTIQAESDLTSNTFTKFYEDVKEIGRKFTQDIPKIDQEGAKLGVQGVEIGNALNGYNSELDAQILEKKLKIETLDEIGKVSGDQIKIGLGDVKNVDSSNLKGVVEELKTFNDNLKSTEGRLEEAAKNLNTQKSQVNEMIADAKRFQDVTGQDMSSLIEKLNGMKSTLGDLEDKIKSGQALYDTIKGEHPEIQKAIISGGGKEFLQRLSNLLSQSTQNLNFQNEKELEELSDSLGSDISSTIAERFQQINPEFDISSIPSNKDALEILNKMSGTSQTTADLQQKMGNMKIKGSELDNKIKVASATIRLSKHLFRTDEAGKAEFKALRDGLTSDLSKIGTDVLNPLNEINGKMEELNNRPVTNYEDLVKQQQELDTLIDEANSAVREVQSNIDSLNANLDKVKNTIHDKHEKNKPGEKKKGPVPQENVEDAIVNDYMNLLGQLQGLSEKQIEAMGIKELLGKYNEYKKGDVTAKPTVNDLGQLQEFLEKWEKTFPDEKTARDFTGCLMSPGDPSCRSHSGITHTVGAVVGMVTMGPTVVAPLAAAGVKAGIAGAVTGVAGYIGWGYTPTVVQGWISSAASSTVSAASTAASSAASAASAAASKAASTVANLSPEAQAKILSGVNKVEDVVDYVSEGVPSFNRAEASLEAFANLVSKAGELTEENSELMGKINHAMGEDGGLRERASLVYEFGSDVLPTSKLMWGDGILDPENLDQFLYENDPLYEWYANPEDILKRQGIDLGLYR